MAATSSACWPRVVLAWLLELNYQRYAEEEATRVPAAGLNEKGGSAKWHEGAEHKDTKDDGGALKLF